MKNTLLSAAHANRNVYNYIDDSVINLIELTEGKKCEEARDILKKIKERKIYESIWINNKSNSKIIEYLNEKFGGKDLFFEIKREIPYAVSRLEIV